MIDHLRQLEAEAIYILRETAAQFERPALLFSGGKDSITLVHLSLKAFRPGKFPYPLVHIDTGHNFPETITYRDDMVKEIDETLVARYVQDSINKGTAVEEKGRFASRNTLQTVTLLETIEEFRFDACIGGARRDEADFIKLEDEKVAARPVRFRTVGDMTCTAAVESDAASVAEIISEIKVSNTTERGSRLDDRRSESAMEDRKRSGYF
ncbi:MAG: phosphoadenosine phosphosulfate reductase family protein [Spirochaetia bacterium]|nr:phosphoadenosine phosphosulfate reductase family protein [Spirochaetia bacterium]